MLRAVPPHPIFGVKDLLEVVEFPQEMLTGKWEPEVCVRGWG